MDTYSTSWRKGNLLKKYTETTGSSTLVKEITSRRFPDYDKFNWEDMDYGKVYHGGHFIHNTQASKLESILSEGLDMQSDNIGYRSNSFLWCVNPEIESRNRKEPIKDIWTGYGGTSIIFHVPKGVHVDQLNVDQYGVWGAIPPEYIDSIDMKRDLLDILNEFEIELNRLSILDNKEDNNNIWNILNKSANKLKTQPNSLEEI